MVLSSEDQKYIPLCNYFRRNIKSPSASILFFPLCVHISPPLSSVHATHYLFHFPFPSLHIWWKDLKEKTCSNVVLSLMVRHWGNIPLDSQKPFELKQYYCNILMKRKVQLICFCKYKIAYAPACISFCYWSTNPNHTKIMLIIDMGTGFFVFFPVFFQLPDEKIFSETHLKFFFCYAFLR